MRIAECEMRNEKTFYREGGSKHSFVVCLLSSVLCLLILASRSFAEESPSLSGRLSARGVEALDDDSVKEDPSLTGRLKFDAAGATWRFHSWLEGGWDGAVRRPPRDRLLFKTYDKVYQDNTPYLEFKEIYGQYSSGSLDFRAGIQRFSWGRLDEYPPNDLFNPWDYTQFLRKPLEDRKIGVPSVSASASAGDWTYQAVWVPWLVPYRLAQPDARWSGISIPEQISQIPGVEIVPRESRLPARSSENSSAGLRIQRTGEIEWAINLFHGFDPRPVFRTTSLLATMPEPGKFVIDPGYVPSFHKITVIGADAAAVKGDFSIRAEAAYTFNRYFNVRQELWGYPSFVLPGIPFPLKPIEARSDTLDYGVGADYRPFEDGLITMQAQQTVIFDRTDMFFEKKLETIIWANLKVGWLNQKVETNAGIFYNPEHASYMEKANAYYTFTDSWKAGVTAVFFHGPAQSIFGRFAHNDQIEAEVIYSW